MGLLIGPPVPLLPVSELGDYSSRYERSDVFFLRLLNIGRQTEQPFGHNDSDLYHKTVCTELYQSASSSVRL